MLAAVAANRRCVASVCRRHQGHRHQRTRRSGRWTEIRRALGGQTDCGDAYSPGWFELPLRKGRSASVALSADMPTPTFSLMEEISANRAVENKLALNRAKFPEADLFGRQLTVAARAYVVRRGSGRTVIAGYPWFLDWGRDSLIAARGLLAAGMVVDVAELLIVFGRFVENNVMVDESFNPHVWFAESGDIFMHNIVWTAYRPAKMPRPPWGQEMDYNLVQKDGTLTNVPAIRLQQPTTLTKIVDC